MLGFGVFVHIAHILGLFRAFFGPYLGPFVESKGTNGHFDMVKSGRARAVATVYLVWAFCPGLGAIFGEKWLLLDGNRAALGGHVPTWRHRTGRPPLRVWLKA